MRDPDRLLVHRFLIAVLVCNLLLLAWYLGVDYRAYLHSDSAVKNVLAQEMLDTGSYFPAQWNYVNGDLWVFFTHTVVLPFLLFLPNGFAAHACAGFVTAGLVLHATWLLARLTGQTHTARLATLIVMSAGLSHNLAENLYGQAAYGLLYCMGVWLLVCTVRACQASGGGRARWTAAAAAILLLAFWANPQRAAAYYLAPLLAAAVVALLRRRALPAPRDVALAACLLAGAAAGTLLYVYIRSHANSMGTGVTLFYATAQVMRGNALRLFDGLFLLLTTLPEPGARVLSGRGIVAGMYQVAAALFLFVLLPWTVRRAWGQRAAPLDAALVFALAGLSAAVFFSLTTTLTSYSSSDGAIRYLVPHLMVLLVLFVGMAVDRHALTTPLAVASLAVAGLFGASSLRTYGPVTAADYTRVHTQQADRMIAFMRQQGLEYGYAPFWDAGRLTVLAAHSVRLRQISIQNGLPVPMRHLSSDRWYQPDTWHGRTFLLLNTEEQAQFRPDLMTARAGAPAATLDFEGWRFVVYDHNIAADLPSWDMKYSKARHFAADGAMPHLVGKVQESPRAIVAEQGETGVLAFGQNLALAPGRYTATFDIAVDGTGSDFGAVDVVSSGGKTRHGTLPVVTAGRQQLVVPVTVERTTSDLELRAISNGRARATLYGITLQAVQP